MHIKAKTVDEYMRKVPVVRRAALSRLRELCRQILVGYEEMLEYGMPAYHPKDSEAAVAFASQTDYISIHMLSKEVIDKYRAQLPDAGKGWIRFTHPDKIDFSVIEKLLHDICRLNRPRPSVTEPAART